MLDFSVTQTPTLRASPWQGTNVTYFSVTKSLTLGTSLWQRHWRYIFLRDSHWSYGLLRDTGTDVTDFSVTQALKSDFSVTHALTLHTSPWQRRWRYILLRDTLWLRCRVVWKTVTNIPKKTVARSSEMYHSTSRHTPQDQRKYSFISHTHRVTFPLEFSQSNGATTNYHLKKYYYFLPSGITSYLLFI
jgi:hypothetical protein